MVDITHNSNIVIGSCTSVDINDPHVIQIARFALKEQGENWVLDRVVCGQLIHVFLHNKNYYNLILTAKPRQTYLFGFYNVVVLENSHGGQELKLLSFVPLH